MDCLAKKCRNKSIGIHFMCQCVLSTACESTVCRSTSTSSSTNEGSLSTNVRKRGKGCKTSCMPVVLHKAAVPSCKGQACRTPGALMPAAQGGEECQHQWQQDQPRAQHQGSALWGWRETTAPACFLLILQQEVCTSQKFPEDSGAARAVKKHATWFQAMVCICIASCCLHMDKFRICIPFAHFNTVYEFTEWTLNSDVAGKDCLLN